MNEHAHMARVYLAQARHIRIKQPQHAKWYWTLMSWAAARRKAYATSLNTTPAKGQLTLDF